MQTDPNFANYLYYRSTQQIVLLDFGATCEISPKVADQYRRLILAGLAGDAPALESIAQEIGFIAGQTRQDHRDRIVRMMQLVFAALRDAPVIDFTNTELSQQMQSEGMALAEDGFVPPPVPIEVLLLQRKFGGVFLLAARLGARVDVAALVARYVSL